jgi:hypothetical protein
MASELQKSAIGDGALGGSPEKPQEHPKRWKQFLITVGSVYPLTVVIPIALAWLPHFLVPLRMSVIRGMVSATLQWPACCSWPFLCSTASFDDDC